MDPCYTDFDELEFLSIASYNNRESKRSVTSPISFVQQFKAMSMLGWGGDKFFILLTQSEYKKNQ